MSISSKKDSEFLAEFIQYYKQLPALWNKKTQAYYNPTTKNKSYMLLLKKYREKYPRATLEDVKKKIAMLRMRCRRYYRRTLVDPQISKHYLREMYFIIQCEDAESAVTKSSEPIDVEATYLELKCDSLESDVAAADPWYNQDDDGSEPELISTDCATKDIDECETSDSDTVHVKIKNETLKQSTPRAYKDKNENRIKTKVSPINIDVEDKNQDWWKWMSTEFTKLDPVQLMIAKKAITDVLLVGRRGLLTKEAVHINAPDVQNKRRLN